MKLLTPFMITVGAFSAMTAANGQDIIDSIMVDNTNTPVANTATVEISTESVGTAETTKIETSPSMLRVNVESGPEVSSAGSDFVLVVGSADSSLSSSAASASSTSSSSSSEAPSTSSSATSGSGATNSTSSPIPQTTSASGSGSLSSSVTTPTPTPTSTNSTSPPTSAPVAVGKGTNPLVIKGYRFFDSVTGEYFPFRGVNYYPRPNTGLLDANNLDLFTDTYKHIWQRDLPQFVALSANSIRLYAVDPEQDHSSFMCALQAEGIYVIVDLGSSCQGCEITPDSAPTCYPASYKTRGEKIIQQFSKYDNVIGFSGGNEVNHRSRSTAWMTSNAPCQKKFIRDMRQYIKSCPNMRQIPVGVVMADTDRDFNAQYYNCRTDPTDELENIEWYGINVYVHCEDVDDSQKAAGYQLLVESFKSYQYSVPAILTEFGCLAQSFPTVGGYQAQRTFHDAEWMNDREYSDYFAGGFVFEYSTENANSMSTSPYPFTTFGPQNYGLGYLSPEDCTDEPDANNDCKYNQFPNFYNLAKAYSSYVAKDEPTMSSFQVPSDRSQPSTCPSGSPILSKFDWSDVDTATSLTCPTEGRYQCPAVPLNSKLNSTSSSGSAENSSSGSGVNVGDDEDTTYHYKSSGGINLKEITDSQSGSGSSSGSNNSSKTKSAAPKIAASTALLYVMAVALALAL